MLIVQKVCNELEDGRIAVIGIGESAVFNHINSVCASLQIPYLAVKWDSVDDDTDVNETSSDDTTALPPLSQSTSPNSPIDQALHRPQDNIINIHPPANKLMKVEKKTFFFFSKLVYFKILSFSKDSYVFHSNH